MQGAIRRQAKRATALRGLQLTFSVDSEELLQFVGRSQAFLDPKTQIRWWRAVADFELQRSLRRIQTGRDIQGKPFVPLSPVTIKNKGNNRFLVDSGEMIRSFKIEANKEGFSIVNAKTYASEQNEGNPLKNIPQRQFMGLTQKDQIKLGASYGNLVIGQDISRLLSGS